MNWLAVREAVSSRNKLLQLHKGWIHPELEPYLLGIAGLVNTFEANDFRIPKMEDLPLDQLLALEWFLKLPTYANNLAMSVPILHPKICDLLTDYLQDKEFATNTEESLEYQIPEYVIAGKDPELFEVISTFVQNSLFLIYNLYWGKFPETVESIQLAKYKPTGVKKTQWHHDADSSMTGLINLAPELYTGGGTDIRTSLISYEHIPSIPKGHALVFNGNMVLHRGSEVLSGERYLLVFWVTTDRQKKESV